MQFNGETNDQDLCTLADVLAGSNDVSFPLKQKALFANMKSREVWRTIWKAYGGWIADDSNNTGEPEVKTNLVTTARYIYPFASAQAIEGMEWLDSDGLWYPLKPITLEEIQDQMAETNFMIVPGRPMYYRPVQNGVRLYPDSDTARASALKARVRRDIVAFTPSSTTETPGWDSIHHEGLAIGMAHQHAKINTLEVAPSLAADWVAFLADVTDHWANKFKQNSPTIRKRKDIASNYI